MVSKPLLRSKRAANLTRKAAVLPAGGAELPRMGQTRFIGAALEPAKTFLDSAALSQGEPPVPCAFAWNGTTLRVDAIIRVWRSLKNDRGDEYLAKHWYEIRVDGERSAVIYFDRKARSGQARWWLYTIDDASSADDTSDNG